MTMKSFMNKNKATLIAIIAVFTTAFTSPAIAAGKNDPPVTEVKYLGFVGNNPVFELNLNGIYADNYFITIRDGAGTVIYSEKLSGKAISRKYRIDTEEEIPEGGLRFEVRSVKNKKTDIYVADITENVKREVAVTKL
jgi:hypothetical protein